MAHARALIHAALEGEASAAEREQLAAHLSGCEECRRTDGELRRNDVLLSRREPLPAVEAMRVPRARPLRFLVPAAAMIAAAAFAVLVGTALAGWRAGSSSTSTAANGPAAVVSSVGVCGEAQDQAVRSATRVERVAWKRLSLKDLLDSGQVGVSRDIAGLDEGKLRSTMVCAVAVTGELHVRLGLTDRGPDRWAIFFSIAGSGQSLGLVSSNGGALPPFYDALPSTRTDLVPGTLVEVVDPQTIRVKLESPKMSEEFGDPASFYANRYTDVRPPAGTIANSGVKVGDRVQIFFERDGRDPSGAYPLSVFRFVPVGVATPQLRSPRAGDLPICPGGQTPTLDVSDPPPPGDQPGTGAPSAEDAFRRSYPGITKFTMYPFGSVQPAGDPRALGQGPVWIVAGSDTFVAVSPGSPGPNNWFVYPAQFVGCRDASGLSPANPVPAARS